MEEWGYIEGHKDLMEDHRPLTSQDKVIGRNPPEKCPRPLYSQDCPEGNVPENNQGENLVIKVEVKEEEEEETDFWAHQQRKEEETFNGYQDGVMDGNPAERCPRPLYSQDCLDGNVPENHQGGDLTYNKVEDEAEEERTWGNHPCMREVKEEIPDVTPESLSGNSEENVMSSLNYKVEDKDIMERSSGEDLLTPIVHPDLSYNNPPDHEEPSPDQPQIVTTRTDPTHGKGFHCDVCGGLFRKKSALVTHKKSHTKKLYVCPECGQHFNKKANLVIHVRTHTGEKPYSCSECGKLFTSKSDLGKHERIHTGEKPYSCSECGKCFIQKSQLAIHERSHTGEKPYSCSECGKCFLRKSHLVIHERVHTGERPYSCPECGKSFTSTSDLGRHEKGHSGEKPYSCPECGKCFARKSYLVTHEKSHTGEKPYSCSECGKCFIQKAQLVIHERTHTGERPYSCSECGKSFGDTSHLLKHEKIHKRNLLISII